VADLSRGPLRKAVRRGLAVARDVARRLIDHPSAPLDSRDLSADPATADDLRFCYRLFLRRNPDPIGFGAYRDQIARGVTVQELVSYFVGCPEWMARGLYKASTASHLERVETADFALYVIGADPVVARELITTGEYEPHVARPLRAALRPGAVFVDVGANVGYYSLLAARAVGEHGKVVAFEPSPANLKVLLLNKLTSGLDHLTVYPFAVSDREGLLSLMKIVSIASSRRVTEDELRHLTDADLVYATTLDRALAGEPRVDVIKCDIDGHDFLAMRGATEVLRQRRPLVFAELNPNTLRQFSGVDPADYLRLFAELGYRTTALLRTGESIACDAPTQVLGIIETRALDQLDLMLAPA